MSRRSVPDRLTDSLGGEFSKPELQTLGRLGTLIQVAAGQELNTNGPSGDEVFVVISGTAEVSYDGQLSGTSGVGAVFGEGALADSAPHDMSVVATTALSAFSFGSTAFSSVMSECPRLERSIRDIAARQKANQ